MGDQVRVNTTIYGWTSTIFSFDGDPYNGIVAVDFSQKRERKVVYGANRAGKPLGRTSGKYSVDGFTIRMLRDSALILKTYLTGKGIGSYGDAEFTFGAQLVEPVPGAVPIIVMAESCCITGEKDAHEEGVDELVKEFEISCLAMTENGMRLWSVLRQIP